jgi:predicted nucleotidyltransferase
LSTKNSTFGFTADEWRILHNLIVNPLKQSGATVWIFGSRARGDHRSTSDVDILFDFKNTALPTGGWFFSIKSDLEESRFPFTLDLVDLNNLAVSYRENILKERVEI